MKVRSRHLLPLTLALMLPVAAESKTLKETVVDALSVHPVQDRAAERYAASEETVKMDESGYYPKADLTLGVGRKWVYGNGSSDGFSRTEAGLSISQMLFDGYRTKSQVESSEASARAEFARVEEQAEDIAFQTAQVFIDVIRQRQLLESTSQNLSAHQETYDKISRRAQQGIGSQADQTQARGRLALAQYNQTVAEGNLWESEINFERVVGYKPGELELPMDDCCEMLPSTAEDARYLSLAETPRFQAAVADHEAALSQIGVARAAMYPQIHLEIDAKSYDGTTSRSAKDETISAMVRLRQNIYRGGSDEAAIAAAERYADVARAQGEKDRRDLQAEAELAYNALEILYRKLPELARHEEEASGTRDAYQQQFTIGQRSLLDLLDAENEWFTANNDLISGTLDEQLARYALLYRVGRLLEFMELAPPEHPEHRNDQGELPAQTETVEAPMEPQAAEGSASS